jgi:hypothetical protein
MEANGKSVSEEAQRQLDAVNLELEQRRREAVVFKSGTTELKWIVRISSGLLLALVIVPFVLLRIPSAAPTCQIVGLYLSITGWVLSGWGLFGSIRARYRTRYTGPFQIYAIIFVIYFGMFGGLLLMFRRMAATG